MGAASCLQSGLTRFGGSHILMLLSQVDWINEATAEDEFIDRIASFDRVGRPTEVFEEGGLRYFVNDFWTARQRQSNRIHEISYRACFKAQLPEFFISRLTKAGDAVYDPFMGRGTTPIQASLMHRRAVGNDVNPLSAMLTRPRLNPPKLSEIKGRLEEVPWESSSAHEDDLLVFYHPSTLAQMEALRAWLTARVEAHAFDSVDDWIRMVALNRLTGHSSGFFSVYTLPPNQAVSANAQRKINERRSQIPPMRDVPTIILKKSAILLSEYERTSGFEPTICIGDASSTPDIPDCSINLIVTSPPFLDIVQYAGDNWLRCWFAGIDPNIVPISMYRTEDSWTAFVRRCFTEFARVVRSGGHVAFEVGEVRNGKVLLERNVAKAVTGLPFDVRGVMVNQQEFTKTSNCWGVQNNQKGTNSNRIVVLKRK